MRNRWIFVALLFTALAVPAFGATLEEKAIKDLTSKDAVKRRDAAESLAEWKHEPAVPALTQALKDKEADVRAMAAYALWNIGEASAPAVPDLKVTLKDPDGLVRIYSAGALAFLGEDPKTLIPSVKEVTADERMWVRAYAIERLLDWEIKVSSLIPEIKSVFESTPAGTPKEKTSMGFFAGFLDTENQDPYAAAKELLAKALAKYPQPPEMLSIWMGALEDPVESVRGYAMTELMEYKPPKPEAIKRICEYTKGFSDFDRTHAMSALGLLEPIPPEVVTVLVAGMKDKQEMVRQSAAGSLAKVKPVTKEVVDALILGLRDKKSDVRDDAAEALEKIGPAGKDAIPVLQEVAAKDKEWTVQMSAKNALRAMGVKVD